MALPIKNRLDSTNFLTNILILIFYGLSAIGITTSLDPEQTITEIVNQNLEYILGTAIPALVNIGFKLTKKFQEGNVPWKNIIKSPNFVSQAIVILAMILSMVGIMMPLDAPAELTEAIFSASMVTIITAVVANIVNPIIHFIRDSKQPDPEPIDEPVNES